MAEKVKTVAEAVNEDVAQVETKKTPVVPEIQTMVEQDPINESVTINEDGVSLIDNSIINDADKVTPIVKLNTTTESQGKDYRLNNKYGAKTAEGETPMNSDLNYQGFFAIGRR